MKLDVNSEEFKQKRLECFSKKSPQKFIDFFDKIAVVHAKLRNSNFVSKTLTKDQLSYLDDLRKAMKELA